MNNQYPFFSDEHLANITISDPDAYGVLIDRYSEKLTRYIRRISNVGPDEIDDILQDVFVKAYQNINAFDTKLSFNSWIYRICHNTTINYWKKNKPYTTGLSFDAEEMVGALSEVSMDDSLRELIDVQSDIETVGLALAKIKEKHRTILILQYFEHKDYREISDILKISMGTVASHIHRAKKSLEKEIINLHQ